MTKTIFIAALLAGGPALAGEHKVVEGEHMWSLAQRYYGNHYKWRAIAEANPQVKNPDLIYPKQTLIIPDIAEPAPAPVAASAPIDTGLAVETGAPVEEKPVALAQGSGTIAPSEEEKPAPPTKIELPPVEEDDGLSVKMPESLAGQYPSMSRVMVEKSWKADGTIVQSGDFEMMAAQGDVIEAKLSGDAAVRAGDTFYVLRPDAPEEGESTNAKYLLRVGIVKAESDAGKGRWKFLILKSGDSLQIDDMLSRKAL